jgi:hypothetical protein
MPLCPQITITPVTVTSTGMTTNDVIPNVFVNTEELDSVATSVNGKTKTYRQASAPTGTDINDGDLWFDTDDGNKLYMRVAGAWVSVQDLAIAAAQTTADGKNKIFRSPTPPTATAVGDTWFDTDDGNKLYFWNGTAWIDVQDDAISAAQATADSKIKTFYQTTAPTATGVGDIWFDTDEGFKQYFWNGSAWTSVQDTSIAAATSAATAATAAAAAATAAATAAQTTADGKNKIYRQTTMPTTGPFSEGDLWFDTDDDNRFYRYTSGAFSAFSLGNNAIANLSANKLTAGTIDASVITVSNINAGNISTGTLNADRIAAASITGAKIVGGTIEASNIASGTITATQIATGTITASQIAASTITGAKIAAGTLTADNIAANTIVASKIAASTITATQIAFATITGDNIAGETITALEIAAESITVDRLSAGTLTAFTLQTSTGNRRVTISASTNSIAFREAGTNVGFIGPTSISGVIMHYGTSFNAGATAYPQAFVSSGSAQIAFSSTKYCEVSNTGVVVSGDFYSLTTFYNQDSSLSANAANTRMDSDGRTRRSTASSARFKEDITDIANVQDVAPSKLLSLPIRAFKFKADYLDSTDNRAGVMVPGFVAEEVAEHYPIAADLNDGVVENWNERFIIPGMLGLIQDLHARVEKLESK